MKRVPSHHDGWARDAEHCLSHYSLGRLIVKRCKSQQTSTRPTSQRQSIPSSILRCDLWRRVRGFMDDLHLVAVGEIDGRLQDDFVAFLYTVTISTSVP